MMLFLFLVLCLDTAHGLAHSRCSVNVSSLDSPAMVRIFENLIGFYSLNN